jgi:hypothetical protein
LKKDLMPMSWKIPMPAAIEKALFSRRITETLEAEATPMASRRAD